MISRRFPSRSMAASRHTGGFTLVELLVSVALVALMMLLFAQVFQMAAGSVTQQKGMAELDQRERMLVTILRGDLDQRSFRIVSPFPSGLTSLPSPLPAGFSMDDRRGYLSISENDINDNTDDVLQFTIEQDPTDADSREELPFSGRATLLKYSGDDPDDYDTESERNSQLLAALNQPEFDDGVGLENGVGSSKAAEVSYFLRNGTLYRRVLLIRDKFTDPTETDRQPEQLANGVNYGTSYVGSLTSATEPGTGNGTFWHDFDYSAYYYTSSSVDRLRFNHIGALDNNPAGASSLGAITEFGNVPRSLGIPHLRFGHGLFANDGTTVLDGRPREYDSSSPAKWIGRYTMRETADPAFGYPGRIPQVSGSDASPMDPATTVTINGEGVVDEYDDGDRGGEDILLTNVHEFDIKVFDDYVEDQNGNGTLDSGEYDNGNGTLDSLNKFVDLGHSETSGGTPVGYYHSSKNEGSQGNRFDTWHPSMPSGFPPPYRATRPGSAGTWPDDEAPLRAILIRIRYLDVKSNQMRQVTMGYTFSK
ncbi:MAG: prepilin-type N-terminal cleavage/methylation domain-containing protein [Planctomycetaceae bacterium]|nr:prepilin-type N-terminal cleavage/methylation domain-containing protein [Planctomycetaceae bacterium]